MAACAVCIACPSYGLVVGSTGRDQGRRVPSVVGTRRENPNVRPGYNFSSSSPGPFTFGRSSALHVSRAGLSSVSGMRILSMAGDDNLAKRARDLRKIEEFMPDLDELDKDELDGFLELELESSTSFETFRHYEIMFLIHEKNADEVQAVIKKVQDFIAENEGRIYRLNDWGMRSLAYDIKKASKANYVLMNIEINSQAINVLNALFEKDERVIRHMVMSQKAAISADSVPPEEYRSSRVVEEEEEEEEEYDDDGEEEDEEEEETELVLQRE